MPGTPTDALGAPIEPGAPGVGAPRLADRLGSRENNFDLLRLLAAWAVLVSHSFALVGKPEPLHQMNTTLGNLGVLVFFGVSGLLITRSWVKDPSVRDFWIKRALRLLPALAVVAVATAFVIGPIFTHLSLREYFGSVQPWIYPFRIIAMFPFGAGLPGVFTHGPYGGSVNGPLWSLPIEVLAYGLVSLLGILGLLLNRSVVVAVTALGLIWAAIWVPLTSPSVGATFVLAAFAVGALAYFYSEHVPLTWKLALPLAAVTIAAGFGPTSVRVVVWCVTVPYLCFWFSLAIGKIRDPFTRFGDASYGLYIWAFPVQQGIVQLRPESSPWFVIAVATPIVFALAQLSWHLVERPALRRKPHPTLRTL